MDLITKLSNLLTSSVLSYPSVTKLKHKIIYLLDRIKSTLSIILSKITKRYFTLSLDICVRILKPFFFLALNMVNPPKILLIPTFKEQILIVRIFIMNHF